MRLRAAELSLPDQGESAPGIVLLDSEPGGRPRPVLSGIRVDFITIRNSSSTLLLRCVR